MDCWSSVASLFNNCFMLLLCFGLVDLGICRLHIVFYVHSHHLSWHWASIIAANVYHGDLKPKNILANSNYKLKICHFGLARVAFIDTPITVFGMLCKGGGSVLLFIGLNDNGYQIWYICPAGLCCNKMIQRYRAFWILLLHGEPYSYIIQMLTILTEEFS